MSRPIAIDALSWIKTEIDHLLRVVRDSIAKFLASPDDVTVLSICPDQLHQVAGALRIVGLTGATRLCETIENAFAGAGDGQRLSRKTVDVVDSAVLTLKEFIDGLSKGEANAPLKLFPVYRELATLQGKTDISEKDLFFPDLSTAAPPHPAARTLAADELTGYLQTQRTCFQRGFLTWLRNPTDPRGLQEMRQALDALDQIAGQLPEPRSFWWSAVGLVDGFLQEPPAEWVASTKPVCVKIDLRIRDIAAGSQQPDEQLARDTLYALATCRSVTQRIKEIKQLYQLDRLLPEPDILMEFDMDWLQPALDDVRSRLEAVKNTWLQYVSGEPRSLAKFRELTTALKTKANELGKHQLVQLLDVITLVSTRLPDPYPQQGQLMIMEMASAFMLVESILDSFTDLPEDVEEQVVIMVGWLLDAAKGKSAGQPPEGLRADLSQQIGQMQLQAQVAREILTNLQHIEQVLDAFARDTSKRDSLATLTPQIKQIHGALLILRFQRANELLSICESMITECGSKNASDIAKDMDWIAEGLSSLGFYLDPCLRARPPAELALDRFFTRFEQRAVQPIIASPENESATATAARAEVISPAQQTETAPEEELHPASDSAAPPPAPAEVPAEAVPPPQPSAATVAAVDPELLGIFLDEAQEVLANIDGAVPLCRQQPDNREALTTIRRGFHTLKGSGRMVGLSDLGEIAWEIEQVMNRWLDERQPATPALLDLITAASTSFAAWITELKSGATLQIDARHILEFVRSLKDGTKPSAGMPAAAPPIAPAGAAAPTPAIEVPLPAVPAIPVPEAEVVIGTLQLPRTFYDIYLREAQQHLAALETEFNAWHTHTGQELSHEFMRAAHTLASSSRTAGFSPIADLASALEQWLPHARFVVDHHQAQPLEAAITKLHGMLVRVAQQQDPGDASAEAATLRDLATRPLVAPPPSPITRAQPSVSTPPLQEPPLPRDEPPAPASELPTAAAPISDARIIAKAAGPQIREQRAIRDDIDPQLLPIFLEEAQGLLPLVGNDLRDWKANLGDLKLSQSLKRSLHTLKGSARMAGAMRLGELAHLMESRIESALESGSPAAGLLEELVLQMDRLTEAVERLHAGDTTVTQPAQPETAPVAVLEAAPRAEPSLPSLAATLRINAETLDWLINESGEVSISRSRIEGELGTLKQSMLDLNDSVARLRTQLREVEIQADSQMQSRLSVLDQGKHDFDPLEFDRYTRLQELTRMMAESLHDVTAIQQTLLKDLGEVDAALLQQARINRDLQQELMRMRTVPFSNLSERLYRIARQTARELEKKANLEIQGSQVELDRSVLERISAPLEHMLRNAVGHGLESPDERRAAGKPEIGEISIKLQQESNEIVIIVSDDGAGLDLEKMRSKAQEKGLLPAGQKASDADLMQLIFEPGFSTAEAITELSGRGVGMDVVRNEILAIGGRIETATIRGQGTTFTIYLPLTLAVAQAVLVRGGGDVFAISSAIVEQVLRLKPDALAKLYERGAVESQGHSYPLCCLRHLVGLADGAPELHNYNSVLLLRSGIQRTALHVDELLRNQEIVVKNIGPQLSRVPGITGATVLGDGRIVLIINPVQLAQRTHGIGVAPAIPEPTTGAPASRVVMVVDDSLTVRKITGRLLEREGYRVLAAKDGLDALEQIKDTLPDVMLVDIEMPRMDGFDLTRNVRNDPRTSRVPIIIISSRTAEKHRSHALELGVNAFLGKPYQETELLQQISQLIEARPTLH